jgi:hypothetical protein
MSEVESICGEVQKSAGEFAGAAMQSDLGRHEVRYSITGEADVLVNGGMSLFRGRILNISNSGCYVQTMSQTRLPQGTPVELVLRVKQKVLNISAEARFSKSKVGMGFLFVKMPDNIHGMLCELIEAMQADDKEEEAAPRTVWQDAV